MFVFCAADICEGCVERVHGMAVKRHGEIVQVHGETCSALESCFSQHFSSLDSLFLSRCHCCLLRQVIIDPLSLSLFSLLAIQATSHKLKIGTRNINLKKLTRGLVCFNFNRTWGIFYMIKGTIVYSWYFPSFSLLAIQVTGNKLNMIRIYPSFYYYTWPNFMLSICGKKRCCVQLSRF